MQLGTSTLDAELRRFLEEDDDWLGPRFSALIGRWDVAEHVGLDNELILETAAAVCRRLSDLDWTSDSAPENCSVGLRSLAGLLACGGDVVKSFILEQWLPQLEGACDFLAAHIATECRQFRSSTSLLAAIPVLLASGLDELTGSDLLCLCNGDIAVFMRTCVEGLTGVPRLAEPLSRALYFLTTPQGFAEVDERKLEDSSNNASIVVLQGRQHGHLRRVALCFLQYDVLSAVMTGAGAASEQHRAAIVAPYLAALVNLCAHDNLASTTRLLGRHHAIRFPTFGYRCLAPFIRGALERDERAARCCLRGLSWLLDGSPEFSAAIQPLTSEWLVRSVRKEVAPSTGHVLLALCALTGPLSATLRQSLMDLDPGIREALRNEAVRVALRGAMKRPPKERCAELEELEVWAEPQTSVSQQCVEEENEDDSDAAGCWYLGGGGINWNDNGMPNVMGGHTQDVPHFGAEGAMGACSWVAAEPRLPPSSAPWGAAAELLHEAPQRLRCALDGRVASVHPVCCPCGCGSIFEAHGPLLHEALRRSRNRCPITGTALNETTEPSSWPVHRGHLEAILIWSELMSCPSGVV